MAKKYVKAYYDWIEQTSALSDAEKGRLFTAILEYARSGREPENSGREGLVFPAFKATIDRENEISAIRSENGSKGGRPVKANESKIKQTKANESKQKPTKDIRHKTQDIMTQDIRHKTQEDNNARDAFAAFAAEDVELMDVLREFEKMRKSIKKPLTDGAKERLVSKLKSEFPQEQWKAVLEQSIDKCWQDVYPLKERERQQTGTIQHSEKPTDEQMEQLRNAAAAGGTESAKRLRTNLCNK